MARTTVALLPATRAEARRVSQLHTVSSAAYYRAALLLLTVEAYAAVEAGEDPPGQIGDRARTIPTSITHTPLDHAALSLLVPSLYPSASAAYDVAVSTTDPRVLLGNAANYRDVARWVLAKHHGHK